MSGLVRERRHVVKRAVPVKKDVRLGIITAGAVGSAAFTRVRHHVDPSVFISFGKFGSVVFAERSKSLENGLFSVFKVVAVHFAVDNRRINVVKMEPLNSEQTSLEFVISVKRFQIF